MSQNGLRLHNMIIPFHALPISREETDFILNESEFDFILNKSDYRDSTSITGGVRLSKDADILRHEQMSRVKKFIVDKVLDFKNNVLQIEDDFTMSQSWTTINNKGDSHHEHNHPNTILSCVYYAQADSGDFQIKMSKSRLQEGFNFSYNIKQQNQFNSAIYNCQVKTGVIVIFPGHLNHLSLPSTSDKPRIMIGSNFFIEGLVGKEENYEQIYI